MRRPSAIAVGFNYAAMTTEELMAEIADLHQQALSLKPGRLIDY